MSVLFKKRKQSTAQYDQSASSMEFLCDKFRKVIVSENQVKQAKNVKEQGKSNKCSKQKRIKNRKFDHLMNTRPETFVDFNNFLYQRGHLSCQQTNLPYAEKAQLAVQLNNSLIEPRERDSSYSQLDVCMENYFSYSHYDPAEDSNIHNFSFVSDQEAQNQVTFSESSIDDIMATSEQESDELDYQQLLMAEQQQHSKILDDLESFSFQQLQ